MKDKSTRKQKQSKKIIKMATKRTGVLDMVRMGGVTLANGMALAPLTRGRATMPGNLPNDSMEAYYVARSKGGFGLIITEGTQLGPEAVGWYRAPGIWNQEQEAGWSKIVRATKAAGPSKMCMQLWHLGRQGHSSLSDGATPVSASNVKIEGDIHVGPTFDVKAPYEEPRALKLEEIPGTVKMYADGAKRAIAAGFDFVEIHGANGYLVDQFLQSHTNIRDDAYGGSLENRLRFMKEVVEAVSAQVGAEKVGIRFSPNGQFGSMGHEGSEETFTAALKYIASTGIAYVHVMDGLAFGFHGVGEPFTIEKVRKIFDQAGNKTTVIMANCGHTKEVADKYIAEGNADMVAFGRATLNNPDLPIKFQQGSQLAPDLPMPLWYYGDEHGYTNVPLTEEQFFKNVPKEERRRNYQ